MKVWFCKALRKYVNYIIFYKRINTDMIEEPSLFFFPQPKPSFFLFVTCPSPEPWQKDKLRGLWNSSRRICFGIAPLIWSKECKAGAIWTFPVLTDKGACNLIQITWNALSFLPHKTWNLLLLRKLLHLQLLLDAYQVNYTFNLDLRHINYIFSWHSPQECKFTECKFTGSRDIDYFL